MKQRVVGVYEFGHEQVEVVLREGTGGEFYSIPEKGKVPRIKVGADCQAWDQVVTVLFHEAMELAAHREGCRFDRSDELSRDHCGYIFLMTHPQFSNCCARVGELASSCLPDLATKWKYWGRKR